MQQPPAQVFSLIDKFQHIDYLGSIIDIAYFNVKQTLASLELLTALAAPTWLDEQLREIIDIGTSLLKPLDEEDLFPTDLDLRSLTAKATATAAQKYIPNARRYLLRVITFRRISDAVYRMFEGQPRNLDQSFQQGIEEWANLSKQECMDQYGYVEEAPTEAEYRVHMSKEQKQEVEELEKSSLAGVATPMVRSFHWRETTLAGWDEEHNRAIRLEEAATSLKDNMVLGDMIRIVNQMSKSGAVLCNLLEAAGLIHSILKRDNVFHLNPRNPLDAIRLKALGAYACVGPLACVNVGKTSNFHSRGAFEFFVASQGIQAPVFRLDVPSARMNTALWLILFQLSRSKLRAFDCWELVHRCYRSLGVLHDGQSQFYSPVLMSIYRSPAFNSSAIREFGEPGLSPVTLMSTEGVNSCPELPSVVHEWLRTKSGCFQQNPQNRGDTSAATSGPSGMGISNPGIDVDHQPDSTTSGMQTERPSPMLVLLHPSPLSPDPPSPSPSHDPPSPPSHPIKPPTSSLPRNVTLSRPSHTTTTPKKKARPSELGYRPPTSPPRKRKQSQPTSSDVPPLTSCKVTTRKRHWVTTVEKNQYRIDYQAGMDHNRVVEYQDALNLQLSLQAACTTIQRSDREPPDWSPQNMSRAIYIPPDPSHVPPFEFTEASLSQVIDPDHLFEMQDQCISQTERWHRLANLRDLLAANADPQGRVINSLDMPAGGALLCDQHNFIKVYAHHAVAWTATKGLPGTFEPMPIDAFSWQLLGTVGTKSYDHCDSGGVCTYVQPLTGTKLWGLIPRGELPHDFSQLGDRKVAKEYQRQHRAEFKALRPGSMLIMPPGQLHRVVTASAHSEEGGWETGGTFVVGGHFFSGHLLHLTLEARFYESFYGLSLTNVFSFKPEAYLHRMCIYAYQRMKAPPRSSRAATAPPEVMEYSENEGDGSGEELQEHQQEDPLPHWRLIRSPYQIPGLAALVYMIQNADIMEAEKDNELTEDQQAEADVNNGKDGAFMLQRRTAQTAAKKLLALQPPDDASDELRSAYSCFETHVEDFEFIYDHRSGLHEGKWEASETFKKKLHAWETTLVMDCHGPSNDGCRSPLMAWLLAESENTSHYWRTNIRKRTHVSPGSGERSSSEDDGPLSKKSKPSI